MRVRRPCRRRRPTTGTRRDRSQYDLPDNCHVARVDLTVSARQINVGSLKLIRRCHRSRSAKNKLPDHADIISQDQPIAYRPTISINDIPLSASQRRWLVVVDCSQPRSSHNNSVRYARNVQAKGFIRFRKCIGNHLYRNGFYRVARTEGYGSAIDRGIIVRCDSSSIRRRISNDRCSYQRT